MMVVVNKFLKILIYLIIFERSDLIWLGFWGFGDIAG